jgi:Fe2+ transport system protein FeoA
MPAFLGSKSVFLSESKNRSGFANAGLAENHAWFIVSLAVMNTRDDSGPTIGENPPPVSLSPLHLIKVGETVRIRELCGSPEVSCRLRELGLHEGQFIRLIACHSNIICQVCNARLALNAMLAKLILVESPMD